MSAMPPPLVQFPGLLLAAAVLLVVLGPAQAQPSPPPPYNWPTGPRYNTSDVWFAAFEGESGSISITAEAPGGNLKWAAYALYWVDPAAAIKDIKLVNSVNNKTVLTFTLTPVDPADSSQGYGGTFTKGEFTASLEAAGATFADMYSIFVDEESDLIKGPM